MNHQRHHREHQYKECNPFYLGYKDHLHSCPILLEIQIPQLSIQIPTPKSKQNKSNKQKESNSSVVQKLTSSRSDEVKTWDLGGKLLLFIVYSGDGNGKEMNFRLEVEIESI